MSKDIRVIREDCCNIWNNLKDKTKMIDYLIESKQQISDLEAKLAESEKSKEKFKIMYFNECKDYEHLQEYVNDRENSNEWLTQKDNENLENEVKQLKQQLAEVKNSCDYYMNRANDLLLKDQDKISFAVEQLEKVKEKVICGVMDISNDCWCCFVKDGSQYMTSEDLNFALEQEFTYQIEELKKEMK